MAVREPQMSIDEAFRISCEKNGLEVYHRNITRKSFKATDEEGNVFKLDNSLKMRKLIIATIINKIKMKVKKRNKA